MRFYRIDVKLEGKVKVPVYREKDSYYNFTDRMKNRSENFFSASDKECFVFGVDTKKGNEMRLGAAISNQNNIEDVLDRFFKGCGYNAKYLLIEEQTIKSFRADLRSADQHDFIEDEDGAIRELNLEDIAGRFRPFSYGFFAENLVTDKSKKETLDRANKGLFSDSFAPEIERIYSGEKTVSAVGHPVHYFVRTRQPETKKEICNLLISSLYENGRILNRRYSVINITPDSRDYTEKLAKTIYKSNEGGTVIINYEIRERNSDDDSPYASANSNRISSICSVAKKFRNSVLTVFCFDIDSNKTKDAFLQNLTSLPIVDITEDTADSERSKEYLKMRAKEFRIRTDKKLFKDIQDGKTYHADRLEKMFNDWYSEKLHTTVYKQYKDVKTAKAEVVKASAKGNAATELREMIGLEKAKEVIENAVNFYKIQKLYAERGLKAERPSMHMIFTGNPGTAKTTVARLFAEIMRDNGLLSKGDLYEVGRGDLVGKYVGWTAPTVQNYFKQAKGSVLFIDEAYSLVDGHKGSFGDEAINTIVQEMENNRDDLVVIFAGYPDKMEEFLNQNPGLRSRIAFHVNFDDYNTSELIDIADLMIKKTGFEFSDDAHEELNDIFSEAIRIDDFGNGRYVRNLIELSTLRQASRLAKSDMDSLSDEDMKTITKEDIVAPLLKHEEVKYSRIGF